MNVSLASSNIQSKRVFLVVSADEARRIRYTAWIERHITAATVFTAQDGSDALFKLENVPAQVLITEIDLPKVSGLEVVTNSFRHRSVEELSVIIVSPLPDREHFVDDVVRGRVQFLTDIEDEKKFGSCLAKALNRLSLSKDNEYSLHFLAPNQMLFREGDLASSVFFVKSGKLRAFIRSSDQEILLGEIGPGEFVGEMAHINQEPRSASVRSIDDCELIEIPCGTLDLILFSKPAWSQALLRTLSKRLKRTNDQSVVSSKANARLTADE